MAYPTDTHVDLLKSTPSNRLDRYLDNSRATAIFRRFPATTLVLLPYIVLILPQAIIYSNPSLAFIVGVAGIAASATLSFELFFGKHVRIPSAWTRTHATFGRYGRSLFHIAWSTALIGTLANLAKAALGGGTISSQVTGSIPSSPSVQILGLLAPWIYSGTGLLLSAYMAGNCRRITIQSWLLLLTVGQLLQALMTAITAPLITYIISIVLILIYLGEMRLRTAAVFTIIALLLWPTAYSIRNEIRITSGVTVSKTVDAYDRLRYDLQISKAEDITPGIDIHQPSPVELIRYAFVPRVLDPDRPPLSAGRLINTYLGGGANTSFTFLPVTTAYILEGALPVFVLYFLWALILRVLLRQGNGITPIRLMIFSLILGYPLGWFAVYPDSTVALAQSLIASGPILLLLHLSRSPLRPDRQAL